MSCFLLRKCPFVSVNITYISEYLRPIFTRCFTNHLGISICSERIQMKEHTSTNVRLITIAITMLNYGYLFLFLRINFISILRRTSFRLW